MLSTLALGVFSLVSAPPPSTRSPILLRFLLLTWTVLILLQLNFSESSPVNHPRPNPVLPTEIIQTIWDASDPKAKAKLRISHPDFNPALANNGLYQRIEVSVPELFCRVHQGREGYEFPHVLYQFCIFEYDIHSVLQKAFPGQEGVLNCLQSVDSFFSRPNPHAAINNAETLRNSKLQTFYYCFNSFFENAEDSVEPFFQFLISSVRDWTPLQRRAILTFCTEHTISDDFLRLSALSMNHFCPSQAKALVEVSDCNYAYARIHYRFNVAVEEYGETAFGHEEDRALLRSIHYDFKGDLEETHQTYHNIHQQLQLEEEDDDKPLDFPSLIQAVSRGASIHRATHKLFVFQEIKDLIVGGRFVDYLQTLVAHGADLNDGDVGCVLLRAAVDSQQELEWVIQNNLNYLDLMLRFGTLPDIQELAKSDCLSFAVQLNMIPDTRWLIHHGYSMHSHLIYESQHEEMIGLLLPHVADIQPYFFHDAVRNGRMGVVRAIVSTDFSGKVDVNHRDTSGATPLMYAQDLLMVNYLLENGADATLLDGYGLSVLLRRRRFIYSAHEIPNLDRAQLLRAQVRDFARVHSPECVSALVARGAPVHARDALTHRTLIEFAMEGYDLPGIATLIGVGALAFVDQQTKVMMLMQSIKAFNHELVELLLTQGVSYRWVDSRIGISPFEWARTHNWATYCFMRDFLSKR